MSDTRLNRGLLAAIGAGVLATSLLVMGPAGAQAATVIGGPIDLGTAATYGVLGGSEVTNTGPTVVHGDVGVSPLTSITGFTGAPSGHVIGVINDNTSPAGQAKSDLTTAFNAAAGLTPTTSGLAELSGDSLTPGVYSGGALSLANNGTLTLAGTSADSIWIFQAASTLTIGSGTHIIVTGGASACNVFWQVGSSASIGTTAHFVGTVMASASITVTTGAIIKGRLLASTAAVTLESDSITVPTNCAAGTTPVSSGSPAITSGNPTPATAGTPYAFPVTATGTPKPTFDLSKGALPSGLHLGTTNGMIAGTPTSTGKWPITITVNNGVGPAVSGLYTLTVTGTGNGKGSAAGGGAASVTPASLAMTGFDPVEPVLVGSLLLMVGVTLALMRRRAIIRRRSVTD